MNIVEHVSLLHIGAYSGNVPRSIIPGSSCNTMSIFLRNLQSDFSNVFTSLESHQQCSSIFLSAHPCQHLLSSEFLTSAILISVRWNI